MRQGIFRQLLRRPWGLAAFLLLAGGAPFAELADDLTHTAARLHRTGSGVRR